MAAEIHPRSKFVIHSASEGEQGGAGAFWSNYMRWSPHLRDAMRFSVEDRETRRMPRTRGGDARWMLLEDAQDLVSGQSR